MASPKPLSEDDIYRASTQYRLWSFTADSLSELRATTNSLAATRVKDAIQRNGGAENSEDAAENIDCLTVEEEQKLVGFYCEQAMKLGDFCELPTNIKATAVQYLKRFYLSNSPMTYHPKQMMPCALFFATKTDNHYMSLKNFASKLPKVTEESLVAPEYLLTQGLRFTFDVRHPHRGLEGGFMELYAMSMGKYVGPSSTVDKASEIKENILKIEPGGSSKVWERSEAGFQKRLQHVHQRASQLLKTTAILGDAYFLYTPSQIWLGAFMASDEPLCTFYIQTILGEGSDIEDQVVETVHACAALLTDNNSENSGAEKEEDLKRIHKKLNKCRNPEKADITTIGQAEKRSSDKDGDENEKVVKKRKVQDDPFGPAISR